MGIEIIFITLFSIVCGGNRDIVDTPLTPDRNRPILTYSCVN
jgi:hypothetical protein